MDWVYVIAAAAAALALILLAAGTYMYFVYGFRSQNYGKGKRPANAWDEDEDSPENVMMIESCLPYRDELLEARKWIKSHDLKDYSVTSYDGLTLRAKMLPKEGARGIVILMHGYRSNPLHDFSLAVKEYYRMGFSCLMPYQRAHGDSEGKYICFGVKERRDVVSWCEKMDKEFPSVPVILDGMSMGATSVMMAAGLGLPANVRGVVADCGFTSAREILESVMKSKFNMAPFPFLYTTALAVRIFARFGIGSVSTEEELKKNTLPLLIVHGEDDRFVPYSMSERNFAAAKDFCDAKFLSFPGAGHGMSFLSDRERYTEEVEKFVGRCLGAEVRNEEDNN